MDADVSSQADFRILIPGGLLYAYRGWHAPFIAIIIIVAFDACLRGLVMEKRLSPTNQRESSNNAEISSAGTLNDTSKDTAAEDQTIPVTRTDLRDDDKNGIQVVQPPNPKLTPWQVIVRVVSSSRTVSTLLVQFCCGMVCTSTAVV